MSGYLVLEGGAEFGGEMARPDLRAVQLAGGVQAPVIILPTAAAPDHNQDHASREGLAWFRQLGARNVRSLLVVDHASANDPALASQLEAAGLVYLLGGFPAFLAEVLQGSACWEAVRSAYRRGAVIAGSSAGAMVLCAQLYDPGRRELVPGLGLLPNTCFLPHHDTFGSRWEPHIRPLLPQSCLIGVDERTGMIDDGPAGAWQVYGQGCVTVYPPGQAALRYFPGDRFSLEGIP